MPPIDQSEVDEPELAEALLQLGIDPRCLPDFSKVERPPQAKPYQPLSDAEWICIERHVKDAVRFMRPPSAARRFIENLLIGEHSGLSTRYLPADEQESTRQRALRWSLNGRLEQLAADLRSAEELEEDRLAAFDALAGKASEMRERILGARADRLNKRTVF